jgi:Pol polyprotein, beta-barrel domain
MTPHKNLLRNYRAFAQPRKIRAADKGTFDTLGSDTLVISTWVSDGPVEIMLKDTLYVPSIPFALISLGRCDDAGYQARIAYQKCAILSTAGTLLMQAPKIGGLYRLALQQPGNGADQCLTAMEIHRKMGHISHKSLRYLLDHGMVLGIEMSSIGDKITWDTCIKSKIVRKPLPKEPQECSKKFGD